MSNTIEPHAVSAVEELLLRILDDGREVPREDEIYAVLRLLGFRTPETVFFSSPGEIEEDTLAALPGGEVVCKLISPAVAHRTEIGGIRFAPKDPAVLRRIFSDFSATASRHGVELSGMMAARRLEIEDCVPRQLLLSLSQDDAFGPVVAAGIGGTGTEVWNCLLYTSPSPRD